MHVDPLPTAPNFPCAAPLDLMFLLDSSGSIEMTSFGGAPGNFRNKMLGFVKEMIPYFHIGHLNNETQVGVVTFSSSPSAVLRIRLNEYVVFAYCSCS
jgi:hypothetical protein